YGPEAKLACGSEALWLRSHVREMMRSRMVGCCDSTCTYAGMEYAPNGTVHFEQRGGEWVLVGWEAIYVGGLHADLGSKKYNYVRAAMARLAKQTCDETPGVGLWYR